MPSIDVGAEVFRNLALNLAVSAVVDPFAGRSDPLASRDRRRVSNDGHQIAISSGLRLENAEAVLSIVEGDRLDDAGECFLGRWFRLRLHADRQIMYFTAARVNPTAPDGSDVHDPAVAA